MLIPYVTGGVTGEWGDYLRAYVDAGADSVEVGLPFSDPMLDGVTIQRASHRALGRGTTVASVLAEISRVGASVPVIVMTAANLVFRPGADRFCRVLAEAGVAGLIVPDLPLDEAAEVSEAAARHGVDLTLLAAPVTSDERLEEIAARSRRFVYAVSLMGVTGEREQVAGTAYGLVERLRRTAVTKPVVVGFGVSTPDQARAAGRAGDGVVVGSALMRRVLDGASARDLHRDVAALRAALDRSDREDQADRAAHAQIPGDRR